MKKEKAKKILIQEGRYTTVPKHAEDISKAFGLELDKSLIRTKEGWRENIMDASLPRVTISALSENICKRLGKKPDEKTLQTANKMFGAGSYHDLKSEAYARNI